MQNVLNEEDQYICNALYVFFQNLGGGITISLAQTVLQNTLMSKLPQLAPGVSAERVILVGATNLHRVFPGQVLEGILKAYEIAISQTFIIPIATAGLTFFSALFLEWKRLERSQNP